MELKIEIEKDISNKERFFVRDKTEWGTVPEGSFDPVVQRGDRRLVLLVDRFTDGEYDPVPNERIVANGSAGGVSLWQVDTLMDGYYRIIVVSAFAYNNAIQYAEGSVVYDPGERILFKGIENFIPAGTPVSDSYHWEPIRSVTDFPFGSNSTVVSCKDHVHDLRSKLCIAEKALAFADTDCDCPDEELKDNYLDALVYHHAACYAGGFGEFEESGKFLDQVIDRCGEGSKNEKEHGCK